MSIRNRHWESLYLKEVLQYPWISYQYAWKPMDLLSVPLATLPVRMETTSVHFAIKWLVSIATCGGKGPRRLMRNLDIPSLCLNPQFQLMYEFPTKKRDKYTLPPLLTCNSQNWLALTRTAMASMSTGPWGGSSNGQMAFIKLHKNYLNSCILAITPNNPAESIIIIDTMQNHSFQGQHQCHEWACVSVSKGDTG